MRVNPFAPPGSELYCPATREVKVHATSTLYAMMHEQAHGIQHRNRTWAWKLGRCAWNNKRIPLLQLWLEIEATLIARTILRRLDKWTPKACQEARESLLTYCTGPKTEWLVNWLLK